MAIIILGFILITLGIFFRKGKVYKLLLPEVCTMIFITGIALLINSLGLLVDIQLNIEPLNEENILSIIGGITTAYVFFGMATLTERRGFDVWVVLLSTKIFPLFYTIATYILILSLWEISDLIIILFIIAIITLLITGLVQTINLGLYPVLYKDFEKKYKTKLYTDSLNKQKDYKAAVSAFLNFVYGSKVYNLSLFSPVKESKTICFFIKKGKGDLVHFSKEEFQRFIQRTEKFLNGYSISLYRKSSNKPINLKKNKVSNFNSATVRFFYPYQENDYLIEIFTEEDIDIPKIPPFQKWELERVLKKAFSFSNAVSKGTSVGVTDINSLFEHYISAIKDENWIIIESLNEEILLYYTSFWDFLMKENYRYTAKEASAEFDIFSKAFAWKELAQSLSNTYKSFCLSAASKDPFVKEAGKELPLKILYLSHKRQDILSFLNVAQWYFTKEYEAIIKTGNKVEVKNLLLNLRELFYPYSDYLQKYFVFQKEVQTILLSQYLMLAKISIQKGLAENLDIILEHLFNITDFTSEIKDINMKLYREVYNDDIQKMQDSRLYFISLGTKASQISFCLTSWVVKNNFEKEVKDVLFKYLPKSDNQLLKIYIDGERESLGVELWDIEPEVGKNFTAKDMGMDFYDKKVFVEQFLRIPYKENSLRFEDIRSEEKKLSYATYILKLDEIIKNLKNENFSHLDYDYVTSDEFEKFKKLKIASLEKLMEEIRHIEQEEIGEKEISSQNKMVLFNEFYKSYKNLIAEPISLDYLFKNIFKKDILFEKGDILSSNKAFGFDELLNKENFFDDEVQYLHELGEFFAEGFINGETDRFIREISKYAKDINLEKISTKFIRSKNFVLIVTRPALYELYLQKRKSIEFVHESNGLISGKMEVGRRKINIYELEAKEKKFLLLRTPIKGGIKRITTGKKEDARGIFYYSLEFLSENEKLIAELMSKQPRWLSEKNISEEEKVLYLKTKGIIKIYESLDFVNFDKIECYNIKLE